MKVEADEKYYYKEILVGDTTFLVESDGHNVEVSCSTDGQGEAVFFLGVPETKELHKLLGEFLEIHQRT